MTTEYRAIKKFNRTGRLWESVSKCAVRILEGDVLVVDPSIGSRSSMPGYCVLRGGIQRETGVIWVDFTRSTHARLFEIGLCLRTDFAGTDDAGWDVLVVEDVPDRRFSRSGRGSIKQQVQLHRAVGAVHASVDATHVLGVHPSTWHQVVPIGYEKSDAGDAAAMAETVRQYAVAYLAWSVKKRKKPAKVKHSTRRR